MNNLQSSLTEYINEKHTQEECSGFIAGYEKAIEDTKEPVSKSQKISWIITMLIFVMGIIAGFSVGNFPSAMGNICALIWCGLYGLEKFKIKL